VRGPVPRLWRAGVPRLNPFAALLGMVAAPFIFWMGLVARRAPPLGVGGGQAQQPVAPDGASAWWALVMGAAASIEDAANCLRDPDAKKQADGAARHYREAAQKLYAPGVMGTVNPACGVHGPIPCEGAQCICASGVGGAPK
jgi:hypothetical protein